MKKPDQTKRMSEIVKLSQAIAKTSAAMDRAQDTIGKLYEKRANQLAELRYQKILLRWNLP